MALDLATLERQRHERIHAKVYHVGPSVDGPRGDAIPADRLPTHTVGTRSVPSSCGHCGGRLLSVEQPTASHPRGMVTCGTCSRQLCWLAASTTGTRFPQATGIGGRPAATAPRRRTVQRAAVLEGFELMDGCGPSCTNRTGHDAPTHEQYGRWLVRQEVRYDGPSVVRTGPLVIDLDRCDVQMFGQSLILSADEWKVVAALARRVGVVCSYRDIALDLWGAAGIATMGPSIHNIRVKVTRIRSRLGAARVMLETRTGIGLMLLSAPEGEMPESLRPSAGLSGRWARGFDRCEDCGRSDRSHISGGLCTPCYFRARDRRPS